METNVHQCVLFSHSVVSNSAIPWTAAGQASISITNSQSLLKLKSIQSVMPFNYLIVYHSLLLLPSIFPRIRVFSNESVAHIRWPKYWSFSFSITPSERVTGRKARGLQVEKEGCRCQTFLSLLSGRKKQTSDMFSSLYKFKRRFLSPCRVAMTPGLT